MVSLLLITHESLGSSLIQCAQHIIGHPIPNLCQLTVNKHDDPDQVLIRAQTQLQELNSKHGVLILTDICGGTPSNIASRLIVPGKVEVVAGVNLPMLIRTITYREQPLATVVQKAIIGGRDGVFCMDAAVRESDRKNHARSRSGNY